MKGGKAQVWRELGRILMASIVALLPGPCLAQAAAPPLTERLMQDIPARMAADGVPGVVVVLIEGGVPVWTEAFGLAEPATGRAMTQTAAFRVESISKSVTAWGVMHLVADGDIALDDSIWDHVNSWMPPPDTPVMTLRQVLSGTAGLALGDITARYPPDGTVPDLRTFMTRDFAMIAPPGSGFAYSNVGYNLLEILIEDVSGVAFSTFMAERILRPLGVTDASFDWTDELAARMPAAHGLRGQRISSHVYPGRASGGLLADGGAVTAFVRAGMAAPHVASRAVLSDAAIAQMHHPQVSLDGMFGLVAEGYGFGHFTETLSDGRHAVWHGGQGHGWMSHFHLVPESGDAIVILANSQRAWPLFAMILHDWSASLGVEPVGMTRVLQAGTAARIAIALAVAGAALALWIAVMGRPRPRVARIGAGGIALALSVWPLWAAAQEYLFLFSILPGLWPWLAAASGLAGLSLAAVALAPARGW